jgi:RNA polymerase sigma-70 factor, ECF subfamily
LAATEDEIDLVRRAASGNSSAFVALCSAHRDRLWRVVSSVALPSDRDDLAQETIVRAFRSLSAYEGTATFAAWLCRIAVNCAHDYRKSAWRRRVIPLCGVADSAAEACDGPHEIAEQRELQRRVRQAVADLARAQRVAVWLHYFEGFSFAEIARLEGSSESTVRSRINAGLKRLASPLRDYVSDPATADDCRQAQRCET